MAHPHIRDAGLRRITSITGWVAAAALSGVAVISVGIARASDQGSKSTSSANPRANLGSNPGFPETDPGAPLTATGGTGWQPAPNPPTQGLGGGQVVSGGS